MSLITDELQNCIRAVINYSNNQHIRNLWFKYIDFYDINGIYDNYYILFYHSILLIITIYLLSTLIYSRNTNNPHNTLRIF
ncbi:MAG: hypothetical protein ACOVNU_04930 [Candidatus Kapaibacteriota bacterium]